MSRMQFVPRVLAVLAAVAAFHGPAQAQFVGDVFFVEPSMVVPQGETGYLQLALFTGSKPFGAARASVLFDAAKLEIVSVEPVSIGSVTPKINWQNASGVLRLVIVNGQSLTAPFGSVTLARIGFRPLAVLGERVTLSSEVQQPYTADRAPLPAGSGFGAEITVGAVATPAATNARAQAASAIGRTSVKAVASQSELGLRAQRLRPVGHVVELYSPVANDVGQLRKEMVQTTGAFNAGDSPPTPQDGQTR